MKRITVYKSPSEIVAVFRVEEGTLLSRSWMHASESSELLNVLRCVDRSVLRIDACYPNVSGNVYHPFNQYGVDMDIEAHLPKDNTTNEDVETKTIYLAPAPAELPNDGVLSYSTVETAHDVLNAADRTVVLLRHDQLVLANMLRDYSAVLGLSVKAITGLPAVSYSAAFDEAVYSFEKVAYAPFVTELVSAAEMAEAIDAQKKSAYQVEKDGYTRANGKVKQFSSFVGPDEDDEPETFTL